MERKKIRLKGKNRGWQLPYANEYIYVAAEKEEKRKKKKHVLEKKNNIIESLNIKGEIRTYKEAVQQCSH